MNYGYGPDIPGWDWKRADLLVGALKGVLKEVTDHPDDKPKDGNDPYVESDEHGIRIRRITHLSNETKRLLIAEADRAFARVMGVEVR